EEPATHVIRTQQGNPRPRRKAALGHGEHEGALHYGQLPVDGRVLRPLGLSPENVATNVGGADRGHAATAEEWGEVKAHVALDVDERSLSGHAVVVEDGPGGGAEGQVGKRLGDVRAGEPFQTRFGHVSCFVEPGVVARSFGRFVPEDEAVRPWSDQPRTRRPVSVCNFEAIRRPAIAAASTAGAIVRAREIWSYWSGA